MTKEQFDEQFSRLTAEWPRAYGASKAEMFAQEFGGFEYPMFRKTVDQLLRKSKYPPQVTELWATSAEVQAQYNKQEGRAYIKPNFQSHGGDCLPRHENLRRWKLLTHFVSNRKFAIENPDWLRQKIWPNETKEESEKKYASINLETAVRNKRTRSL